MCDRVSAVYTLLLGSERSLAKRLILFAIQTSFFLKHVVRKFSIVRGIVTFRQGLMQAQVAKLALNPGVSKVSKQGMSGGVAALSCP